MRTPRSVFLALIAIGLGTAGGCDHSSLEDDLRHHLDGGDSVDMAGPEHVTMASGPDEGDPQPAPVDPNPTAPAGANGPLGWSSAAQLGEVRYVARRDSVKLVLPKVAGAVDFRAIVLGPKLGVSSDGAGKERVIGSTIVCAGYLQRNTRHAERELIDVIEVPGLSGATHVVIEAIDQACPFVGVVGAAHEDLDRTTSVNPEIAPADSAHYAIYTEAEVEATYGATILNGQGGAARTGMPAPPSAPSVLARTTVTVTPLGTDAAPPTATFFDDFATPDQPTLLADGKECYPDAGCNHPFIDLFGNKKWTFQVAAMDRRQLYIDHGQLHVVVAEGGADTFGSAVAYPRQLAHVDDSAYLHVTYDVATHTSDRRYWWISVCGADQPGKTIAADGSPTSYQNPDSTLQLGDGNNPNLSGFGCFMLFPKDGNPVFGLPFGDGTESPPETSARIYVYKSGTGVTGVNVDPDVYHNGFIAPAWFRELDGSGNIVGPMLDRENLAAPTIHFDLYLRRGRAILYANGRQKLCNDFSPTLMKMPEAMVGFGQVLYHTSAEHNEMAAGSDGPAYMRHVHDNLKYLDRRDWDNLGFEDKVAAPKGFDESACFHSEQQ